jgi:ABC-type lipoprotein export system ATPase subunit/bifunctional DNA-binding transcriptional regulator/antitoxin component of YhaV-PrlF toxin-antitoxin module
MSEEFSTQNSAIIVCDNLVKIYQVAEHDVVALQGLDLVVQTGELVGVVGVSGSGKTTLFNILGGLDRPSAGWVWVDGQNLLKLSSSTLDRYRLNAVGFVWQQSARNLIPYMSAIKNIEMPMMLVGETDRRKRRRAEELLDMVGLVERRNHKLSELSGGEQQRLAIAVALANKPKLLLADEPTGEVDEANAQMIYQIFKDLNQELNLTTLIVSHDIGLAQHVDRVVAIRDGKVATETLRHASDIQSQVEGDPADGRFSYTELTVLDSAGRLQIPKDLMEQFNIQRRVQLEVLDDGILIRPVAAQQTNHEDTQANVSEMRAAQKGNLLQQLISRWLPKRWNRS